MQRDGDVRHVRRPLRRRLSPDELRLWQQAMAGVQPLQPLPAEAPPAPPASPAPAVDQSLAPPAAADARSAAHPRLPARALQPAPRRRPAAELAPGVAADIDRRTLDRLRRGLIAPETQVDLHHCTQEEAHELLSAVLAASQAMGRRCVLVITGKGYRAEGAVGVLKTMVPRWLNEPPNRARVLAFAHARPAHGGEGALYVLLRRRRD